VSSFGVVDIPSLSMGPSAVVDEEKFSETNEYTPELWYTLRK
jgi:hypothetical protein